MDEVGVEEHVDDSDQVVKLLSGGALSVPYLNNSRWRAQNAQIRNRFERETTYRKACSTWYMCSVRVEIE